MAPGQTPKTLNRTQRAQVRFNTGHAAALRAFLIHQGYSLPSHGNSMGALMKSALADWHKGVGQRDPKAWSERAGRAQQAADRAGPSPSQRFTSMPAAQRDRVARAAVAKAVRHPVTGVKYPTNPPHHTTHTDPTTRPTTPKAPSVKTSTGHNIPLSDASFGTLFNVDKTANSMAQEQFQPQINEAQLTVNQDPRQNAQNIKDIKDWYNQVQSGLSNATSSDKAAAAAGVNSTQDATQALVNSLGGSANQGAGEAAAAGQNVSGTLQAMGLAQSNLDSTLAPILQAQAAQQKTNQYNTDQSKLTQDQLALQNLQGQEGNAETNAQMQLESANNSLDQARQQAMLNIQQYNNSLAQQKFQNQLGLTDAQIAAEMNGVNIAKSAAEANYYNSRASNQGRSASQLNDIGSAILGALSSKGLITQTPGGGWAMANNVTPAQVLQAANGIAGGYGSLPSGFVGGTVLGGVQGY